MIETTIRIANSSNVGTTGLTGTEIKFRKSPFGTGDVVTIDGVSGGTNGIYLCSFLTVTYQAVQLWISGVYQSTWGTKMIGNETAYYLSKQSTSTQTMSAAIAMSGFKITGAGAATANGDLTRYEQTALLARDNVFTENNYFTEIPRTTSSRTYSGSLYELIDRLYLETNYGYGSGTPFGIATNRIFVDSKLATDITGKAYNTISEAITYASTQTPSSTSRWLIIVMPHHSSGYAEDITMPQYIDLIGWGQVYITGGFTTTHVTTAQTWSARDSKIENLTFNSTDESYFFRLMHINNCIAKANGAGGEVSYYIDGCEMRNFGIFTQNDVDLQANATEQENHAVNCYGNEEPVWESSDDVGSFSFLGSIWEF